MIRSSGGFPFPGVVEDRFLPYQLRQLVYWFDAQDATTLYQDSDLEVPITADGQPVAGWLNKGSGGSVKQATHTLRPLFRAEYIHGRPAVEADGVDDWLRLETDSLGQPFTAYMVAKAASVVANSHWIAGGAASGDQARIFTAVGSDRMNAGLNLSGGSSTANAALHCCVFNGTNSVYALNGVVVGSGDAGSQGTVGLTLFAQRNNINVVPGGIGEIIIAKGAHTATERAIVEAYLTMRWGL